MKNTEKQILKKRISRLGLFFLIVFIPVLVIAVVLASVGVKQWINVMVLVLVLFVLFALYVFVCDKLDNRKKERMKKKKDPFAD